MMRRGIIALDEQPEADIFGDDDDVADDLVGAGHPRKGVICFVFGAALHIINIMIIESNKWAHSHHYAMSSATFYRGSLFLKKPFSNSSINI